MSASRKPLPPCLPPKLLVEFEGSRYISLPNSVIYTDAFHDFRIRVLRTETDVRPAIVRESPPDSLARGVDIQGGTYLHLAVALPDIALLHECIRLGVPLDHPSARGETPLVVATRMLYETMRAHALGSWARRNKGMDKYICLLRMAQILVEQHANLELVSVHGGLPPLVHATQALEEGLVKLLLLHGSKRARPVFPPAMRVLPQVAVIEESIKNTKALSPRPPRPCPCWSGKLLQDCHAQRQPYPDGFVCFCGSRRLFERCCKARKFEAFEVWDARYGRINTFTMTEEMKTKEGQAMFQAPSGEQLDWVQHCFDGRSPGMMDEQKEAVQQLWSMNADILLRRREIDPAFAHALRTIDFCPKPWDKTYSRAECQTRMELWNTAIDAYIALHSDQRPAREIEASAKIGLDGGALHKRCDNKACAALEGAGTAKLKTCSRCKAAYYCSADCQKHDWADHKQSCGNAQFTAQFLPSQRPYVELMDSVYGPDSTSHMEYLTAPDEETFHALLKAEQAKIPKYFVARVGGLALMVTHPEVSETSEMGRMQLWLARGVRVYLQDLTDLPPEWFLRLEMLGHPKQERTTPVGKGPFEAFLQQMSAGIQRISGYY